MLGLVVPPLLKLRPEWSGQVTDLVWQIPLGVLASMSAFRLIEAPFQMHQVIERESEERGGASSN